MAYLTDRALASGVTLSDLLHIVITGDTSQNPDGSSYKATIQQVGDALSGTLSATTYWTSGSSGNYSLKTINDSTVDSLGDYTISSGFNNLAEGNYTSIIGGNDNTINNTNNASIIGGIYGLISGSTPNSSLASSIFGGFATSSLFPNKILESVSSTIVGGFRNNIEYNSFSILNGGQSNSIIKSYTTHLPIDNYYNSILNGEFNTIDTGKLDSIIGGTQNTITYNVALSGFSFGNIIAGGSNNLIDGHTNSAIIAGTNNTINFDSISNNGIFVGSGNTITGGGFDSIVGGTGNTINGDPLSPNDIGNTIIGGKDNTIFTGTSSTIIGGINNTLISTTGPNFRIENSVILGGQNLTGTTNDTVYVPYLNINSLGAGTPINNLGIDSSGNVVTGTTGSVSDIYVTGGTYSAGTATFTNSSGGTFDVTGFTQPFTGNTSGDCITDLFVSNIHSCSPLNINPLDEGNVYFGSTSGVTIDLTNNRVGINTDTPTEKLHIDNGDILVTNTNGSLRTDIQNAIGPLTLLSGGTTELTRLGVITPTYDAVTFGVRGASEPIGSGYGKQGDAFIYSSTLNNGFNIISQPGTGTDDYVRFFVGQSAGASGTPDLYIQGSGTTRGNVGINTETPTEKLHVNGNTKISEDLFVGDTVYIGNVTGTPSTTESLYITHPSVLSSNESPIITATVDDASSRFVISNNTSINGIFTPRVVGSQKDNNLQPGLFVDGVVLDTLDTTTIPALIFRAIRLDTGGSISEIVNRNLFQWRNLNSIKMTMDVDGNLGIGTSTPSEKLDVVGTNGIFYSKLDDTEVQLQLSAQTTSGVTNISTSSPNAGSLLMGIRGIDNTSNPGFGNQGDSFIYSSIVNNGLNIISQTGTGTKDYIRFYAGQLATTGNTPDLYIEGSGSTRGYVGINNDSPTEQLDVVGNTKISEDLFVGDTVYVGNVTGTPTTPASLYIRQPSITGSSESPIIDIQVDDANSYFRINNATTADGVFSPIILTRQADDSDRVSFYLDSVVSPTYDTPGAVDVVRFRARRDTDFIQNRDLFSWYNYTTRLMDLDKDGNLDIIQGGLRINTLGTGTSVNNLGIDSSGNVVTGVTDTFTGNTSGDCITDLYVTNLYGCSPLHIEPSGLNDVYIVENGGNVGIGTTATTVTLDVAGETRLSGSGQNVLTVIGSGDTQPLFTVQGSSGELFSVTDSLVGSLFSVNDISGLPILEVFDDDTIYMGNYQAPSLNTTVLLNPGTGLSDVYSIPVSAYTGAFFDYTVLNSTGARAGNIMSIFSGSTVEFSETTTNDIGSTSDVTFTMSNDGSNATLQVSATTTGWEVKTIVRSI